MGLNGLFFSRIPHTWVHLAQILGEKQILVVQGTGLGFSSWVDLAVCWQDISHSVSDRQTEPEVLEEAGRLKITGQCILFCPKFMTISFKNLCLILCTQSIMSFHNPIFWETFRLWSQNEWRQNVHCIQACTAHLLCACHAEKKVPGDGEATWEAAESVPSVRCPSSLQLRFLSYLSCFPHWHSVTSSA